MHPFQVIHHDNQVGLCDECGLPKTPQIYIGYGIMLCPDCLLQWKNKEYAQTKTVRTEGDQGVEGAERSTH